MLEAALHVLLPRGCAHCRGDLRLGETGPLCSACEAAIPPPVEPSCIRCAGAICRRRDFCGSCKGRLFAVRLIRAACAYRGPAESLVHAFKFRGSPSAAREAGRIMAKELARKPELGRCDALVPVPLHWFRERQRGYNQAELLARELAAATGIPIRMPLRRQRGGGPSWRLGRQARKDELAGAFTLDSGHAARTKGLRVLLIDDVCASSTTLEECGLALRRAGAVDVVGYVFARSGGK